MSDLTTAQHQRQNILNNRYALQAAEQHLALGGTRFGIKKINEFNDLVDGVLMDEGANRHSLMDLCTMAFCVPRLINSSNRHPLLGLAR